MAPHPATRLRPSASPLSLRHPKLKLLLIPASLAMFAPAHAQNSDEDGARQLQAVTVTGVRADGLKPETVEAGTFRGADIMDVPSTINVVTREALELQAASGLYDALRNTAGVTRQQNGG